MTDEPKFCKDCKHYKAYPAQGMPWGGVIGGYDNCEHPSQVNVVTGIQMSIPAAERRARNSTTGCGYEGLQFEAGPPTPGVMTQMLDIQRESAGKVETILAERDSVTGQHIYPQPKTWWEFWK